MTSQCLRLLSISGFLSLAFLQAGLAMAQQESKPVVWEIDNLKSIGGHAVTVVGSPRLTNGPRKGIDFDGQDDALLLPVHPLAGWPQFTAEVIFRPAAGGPKEQRFFHMQEEGSENRVLFETRLTEDGGWFLDTFIKCDGGEATLFAKDYVHRAGAWQHAAIVVDGRTMRHYVNGQLELSQDLKFTPHKAGQTSLGVRINKVFWYQGAISRARFTPKVLEPSEFWKVD